MPRLRYDEIHKLWVIFAPDRSQRPTDYAKPPTPEIVGECPFCPGNERQTPPEKYSLRRNDSKPDTPGWDIRVVPNKFPALVESEEKGLVESDFEKSIGGFGVHEVIVDTPEHSADIPDMPLNQIAGMLKTYRMRLRELESDDRFEYIQIFRNFGYNAGETFSHPHSQLITLPVIPSIVLTEIEAGFAHFNRKQSCLFCDTIKHEIDSSARVIVRNDKFLVFAPYASRLPFEICVMPVRHSYNFSDISDDEALSLAEALKNSLTSLQNVTGGVDYNILIHSLTHTYVKENRSPEAVYHWHFEILPRLTKAAGFEIGTGFGINSVLPESAAGILRENL